MYKYSHAAISDPRLRDQELVDELFSCLIMKPVYISLGRWPLSFPAAVSMRLFVFLISSPSSHSGHLLLSASDGLLHDLSLMSAASRHSAATTLLPRLPRCHVSLAARPPCVAVALSSPSFVCHLFSLPLSVIILPPLSSIHFHLGTSPRFFSRLLSLLVMPRQLSSVSATEVSPLGPACTSCLNLCTSILSACD